MGALRSGGVREWREAHRAPKTLPKTLEVSDDPRARPSLLQEGALQTMGAVTPLKKEGVDPIRKYTMYPDPPSERSLDITPEFRGEELCCMRRWTCLGLDRLVAETINGWALEANAPMGRAFQRCIIRLPGVVPGHGPELWWSRCPKRRLRLIDL